MFSKYKYANIIVATVSGACEAIFAGLAWSVNMAFGIGFLLAWALSAIYGGWIQWIGAKYHGADGYTITTGIGLQIPFAQFLTLYFTWRFERDQEEQEYLLSSRNANILEQEIANHIKK